MAASKVEIQVLWGGVFSKFMNTTSWFVSDEVTLSTDDWKAMLNARADNQGAPAAGDEVELRILYTVGDMGNEGGVDTYPDVNLAGATASGAPLLGVLDTTRYDPDWLSASINTASKKFKIAARAKQGATRAIVLTLRVLVQRGAIA